MFSKEKKTIKIRAIIEVMGRPPEFLTETLSKTAEHLEKEEGMKVLKKEIAEPKETEEKNLFSSFMEMELTLKDMEKLTDFMMNYLPSNIEVIEPSEISFPINEANAFINNLLEKIHKMDSLTKKTGFENMILKNQLQTLFANSIKVEENKEEQPKVEKKESIEEAVGLEEEKPKKEKKAKKK